jgi:hypothetical protein
MCDMPKTVLLLAASLATLSWTAAACGDRARASALPQAGANTRTVTGQVVCLVCYARNHANTGADHDDGRMCAQACIKWESNPAGVLTADGTVYQLAGGVVANNNAGILPFIARRVSVTGDVYEKDGMRMISAGQLQAAQ